MLKARVSCVALVRRHAAPPVRVEDRTVLVRRSDDLRPTGATGSSNRYTDYPFGVWRDTELVLVAKAYSGLSNSEIAELDDGFARHHREVWPARGRSSLRRC